MTEAVTDTEVLRRLMELLLVSSLSSEVAVRADADAEDSDLAAVAVEAVNKRVLH